MDFKFYSDGSAHSGMGVRNSHTPLLVAVLEVLVSPAPRAAAGAGEQASVGVSVGPLYCIECKLIPCDSRCTALNSAFMPRLCWQVTQRERRVASSTVSVTASKGALPLRLPLFVAAVESLLVVLECGVVCRSVVRPVVSLSAVADTAVTDIPVLLLLPLLDGTIAGSSSCTGTAVTEGASAVASFDLLAPSHALLSCCCWLSSAISAASACELYNGSFQMGKPKNARWTRIWCVRPVCGRHMRHVSSREASYHRVRKSVHESCKYVKLEVNMCAAHADESKYTWQYTQMKASTHVRTNGECRCGHRVQTCGFTQVVFVGACQVGDV